MRIFRLSISELVRRPARNGLIILSISIAVALLTSLTLVSNSANTAILQVIGRMGHTLTIRPVISGVGENNTVKGDFTATDVVLGKYIPESAMTAISKTYDEAIKTGWEKRGGLVSRPGAGGISIQQPTWAPRLYGYANVDGGNLIIAGVDFYKEYVVRFWWKLKTGNWPVDVTGVDPSQPSNDAIVGAAYSRIKGVKTGQTVSVDGAKFNVAGVLEDTNTSDDYMVFIPLKAAQKLLHKEGLVSMLSVRAMCPKCPVGDAVIALNRKVTGITAISQLAVANTQFEFFNMLYKFLLAVVTATLAVGIFSIFTAVTGSLYERAKEIGMLKTVGASRWQIIRIFIYEHFFLGILGGVLGFLLGIGLAYILNSFLSMGAVIQISQQFLWIALILGVVCSLTAIFYPAYKLSKIKISETFRTQWNV